MLGLGLSLLSKAAVVEQGPAPTKTYVYQSDFSANTDGWSDLFGNVTLSSGQTFQGESGVLKVTWNTGGSASLLNISDGTVQTETAYKLSFRFAYEDNTNAEPQQVVFGIRTPTQNIGVQPIYVDGVVDRRDPNIWFDSGELSFTSGTRSSSQLLIDTGGSDHPGAGDVIYITDVEIYYYS